MLHGYFSTPKVEKRKCIQSPLTYHVTYFPITEIKKNVSWEHITGGEIYLGSQFQRNSQS